MLVNIILIFSCYSVAQAIPYEEFYIIQTYIRSVVSSELKVSPVEIIDCGMSDLVEPSL